MTSRRQAMWIPEIFRRLSADWNRSSHALAQIAAGTDNQQKLINDKLTEAIVALTHMSDALRTRLDSVVAGIDQEQRLLNEKLSKVIEQLADQTGVIEPRLSAIIQGLDNNSQLLNNKLNAIIAGTGNQTRVLNEKLDALIHLTAPRPASSLVPGVRTAVVGGQAEGSKRAPS